MSRTEFHEFGIRDFLLAQEVRPGHLYIIFIFIRTARWIPSRRTQSHLDWRTYRNQHELLPRSRPNSFCSAILQLFGSGLKRDLNLLRDALLRGDRKSTRLNS